MRIHDFIRLFLLAPGGDESYSINLDAEHQATHLPLSRASYFFSTRTTVLLRGIAFEFWLLFCVLA